MADTRRTVLALVALVAVWVAGFAMTRLGAPSEPEISWLERLTRSEAFQTQARDGASTGCLALAYQDPQTLVFGSSHADADIDAALLSRELGGRVGVCGLSAFNPDMLPALVDMLDREGLRPERLIWIVDGGSFRLLPNAERRLVFAEAALGGQMGERADAWLERWPEGDFTDGDGLDRQARGYRDGVAAQADSLAALDPDLVTARVRRRADLFYTAIDSLVDGARPHPRATARIADFCDALAARDIPLFAVVSPLPTPSLQRHPGFTALDADTVAASVPCAERIIARPTEEWGLDIRHYLDRKRDPGYDYAIWTPDTTDAAFDAHIAALDRRARLRLYDTDHLNPVGSEIFSRALAEEIKR